MKTGFGDIHAKIDEMSRKIISSDYYIDSSEPIVVKEPPFAWKTVDEPTALRGTYIVSSQKNSYLFFSFFGIGVRIRFRIGTAYGIAKVVIDDKFEYEYDCYSSSDGWYDYVITNLSDENAYHTCKIIVTARKNPSAISSKIGVDRYSIVVKPAYVNVAGQTVNTNAVSIRGQNLTPRDWSLDFEKLQNIDVLLSTRASESTLSSISSDISTISSNIDVLLSSRASESTLSAISSNIDVLLSSRASESTLSTISSNIDTTLSSRASESTLSSFKSQAYDSSLDLYKVYELPQPVVNDLIHNGVAVNSAGSSSLYSIGGAKRVDVLIYVSSVVGSPSAEFSVEVIESASSQVIKSYSSGTITASGSYYIGIDGQANVLGDTIRVSWTGVDGSNYLDGVYTRLIVKP